MKVKVTIPQRFLNLTTKKHNKMVKKLIKLFYEDSCIECKLTSFQHLLEKYEDLSEDYCEEPNFVMNPFFKNNETSQESKSEEMSLSTLIPNQQEKYEEKLSNNQRDLFKQLMKRKERNTEPEYQIDKDILKFVQRVKENEAKVEQQKLSELQQIIIDKLKKRREQQLHLADRIPSESEETSDYTSDSDEVSDSSESIDWDEYDVNQHIKLTNKLVNEFTEKYQPQNYDEKKTVTFDQCNQ